jgi:hypothetical protein
MSGYIDTSTDEALWSSYNGGRAGAGAEHAAVSQFAQWSALMDSKTCDWCGWADERLFDTKTEPYDPPMHHGCRCIIALILKSEFGPTNPSWGKGPPDSAWPPGRRNGADRNGRPTLRNKGKIRPKVDLDKTAKKWADNWSSDLLDDLHGLRLWHNDAMNELVPGNRKGINIMNNFIDRWTGASSRSRKTFAEIMARGNTDEILAFAKANPEMFQAVGGAGRPAVLTIGDAEQFARVWDAHKKLASEVFKKKYPNGVTLHRGVRVRGGSSMDDFYQNLLAGDFEQATGTRFVESWTTNPEVAIEFAEGSDRMLFLHKHVDPDDIFASWLEHPSFNAFGEEEVLWYNWEGTLVPKQILAVEDTGMGTILEVLLW